jgi:ATP-dependent exoDNAse (exonuclease V) beta subunit
MPLVRDEIRENPAFILLKEEAILEEISEKIRLFYVALTRVKEKAIFVGCFEDKKKAKNLFRSFNDFVNYSYDELEIFTKNID